MRSRGSRAVPIALFAGMVVAWGLNYLFVRQGVTYADSLWLAAARSAIGAGVTAAWLRAAGRPIRGLGAKGVRDALVIGVPTTGLFFGLWFTAAEQVLPGEAAVIVYTFPLWVAALSPPVLGHRLRAAQVAAMLAGFAGVGLVALPPGTAGTTADIGPIAELLLAAFCWALGTVVFRRRFAPSEMERANLWQLLGGTAALAVGLLGFQRTDLPHVALPLGLDLLWLGVIGTGFAYIVWYRFLAEVQAARLSTFVFLVPVVALVASALLFAERLVVWQLAGVGLIVLATGAVGAMREVPGAARPDTSRG